MLAGRFCPPSHPKKGQTSAIDGVSTSTKMKANILQQNMIETSLHPSAISGRKNHSKKWPHDPSKWHTPLSLLDLNSQDFLSPKNGILCQGIGGLMAWSTRVGWHQVILAPLCHEAFGFLGWVVKDTRDKTRVDALVWKKHTYIYIYVHNSTYISKYTYTY